MTSYSIAALNEYKLADARDSRLPTIYIVDNHPLHPPTNPGRTFVVIVRPTIAAMEEAEQFEKSLQIPHGQKEELDAQGLLELESGDHLYGRNELGSGAPEDDVLLAWAVGPGSLPDDVKTSLDAATHNALGPRAERTPTMVRMEQYFRPVKPDTRCISVASSLERQPTIVAPAAQLKDPAHTEEVRGIASDLASAVAPIAMHSMHQAPAGVQDAIRRRSEMLGLPRLGSADNWAYQALQANIASVPQDSSGDLSQQMGFFGKAHFDEGDSAGHYTNMITNSDLPDGYDPGYFHLLALGVYVRLRNNGGFNFQGNRKHGGTGPFPPCGETPPPHAYRFNLVSYPPANMMNPTQTRWRVAMNPGIPAYLTPEMRDPEYHPPCTSTTGNESATFFRHGYVYMDRASQGEFFSRALYDMCRYYANQVPNDTGFLIDPDTFLDAFQYRAEDGVLRKVPRWETAPRVEADQPAATRIKQQHAETRRMWEDHYKRTAGLVPSRFLRSAVLRKAVGCPDEDRVNTVKQLPSKATRNRKRKRTDEGPNATKKTKTIEGPRIVVPASGQQGEDEEAGGGNQTQLGKGKIVQTGEGAGAASKVSSGKGKAAQTTDDAGGARKGTRSKGKGKENVSQNDNSRFSFAFCRATTAEVLENELYQLMREVKAGAEMGDTVTLSTVTKTVKQNVEAVDISPRASASGEEVEAIVENVANIEAILDLRGIDVRHSRIAATTGRSRVWQWLNEDLKTMVMEECDDKGRRGDHNPWLTGLVDKVQTVLQGGIEASTFSSAELRFHRPEADVRFLFVNGKSRRKLAGQELKEAECEAVSEIVSGWIHYSKDANLKLEWFVSALRDALGEEIMTMEHTWRFIRNFKSTYVSSGSHPSRTTDPASTFPFRAEIARHPILQESTREHEIYNQFQRLFRGEISADDVTIAFGAGPGWAKYVSMWRGALAYIHSPTTAAQTKYEQLLRDDPDFYLPIRERAPCRTRSTGAGSIYEEQTIKTLPGIFSAIVFRAITYRSPFFFNHDTLFDDWQDFTDKIDAIIDSPGFEGMKRDSAYFTVPKPYGKPNPQRSVELAETYFESMNERRWPQFCKRKRTFSETMKYFTPPKAEKNIFPQLGDLTRMGLVCDLAYASVCEMPTLGDMAECMVILASGGLKGLRILGVLDEFPKRLPKDRKVKLVQDSLQQVMDFMERKFSKDERREMGLDPIVLEHSLCKLGRAEKDL